MKIVGDILLFRFRQGKRALQSVGVGNLILLTPLLFVVILGALQHISTSTNYSTVAFIALVLLPFHWNRKDRFYLEQITPQLFWIFLVEYLCSNSLLILTLLYFGKWQASLLLIAVIGLIALIKPSYFKNVRAIKGVSLHWIPLPIFEWRIGLRRNFWGYSLLYILSLFLSFYTVAVPLTLLLASFAVVNFFQDLENKDILLAINQKRQLLVLKTRLSLFLFNGLFLPHYLLYLYFHTSYWFVLPLIIFITNMLLTFVICVKYKNYRFGHRKVYASLPIGIFIACLAIPFLWPIPIMMLLIFWRQAQQNLIYHYA